MTELIKTWLTGIITAAVFSSAALAISENTSAHKYVKYMTSLVILIAVLFPLRDVRGRFIKEVYVDYYDSLCSEPWGMAQDSFMEDLGQELEKRTEEAAERLGIECRVNVECVSEKDCIIPVRCTVAHRYSPDLDQWIRENLGIQDIKWKN